MAVPTIQRRTINNYTKAINTISGRGRDELAAALSRVDLAGDVSGVRALCVEIMQACCGASVATTEALAAEFYDGLRERVTGERMGALAESGRAPEATEGAVRAFAQLLADGKRDAFTRALLGRLDYEVKRSAADTVVTNVKRDPLDVRYARVPTGAETCKFCVMLASRGPVYHSRRSAGAVDHYHAGCDCRVVPCWDSIEVGPSRRRSIATSIEGYDPDALYDRYVGFMGDPAFRESVARSASHGRGGDRGPGTHPMIWVENARRGIVTYESVGEISQAIDAVGTYEELFDLIDLLTREWPYYALGEPYRASIQQHLSHRRLELLAQGK